MAYLKIGGAALNQTPLDWSNNVGNIIEAIEKAKSENIRILCLPELAITGYGCEDLFLAPWVSAKAVEKLFEIREYCEDISVAVGLPVSFEGKVYNCCALIRNKKIEGIYAKQFLAKDGVHYEPRWFTPWEKEIITQIELQGELIPIGELTFETEGIKTGFEICEDAWVADNVRPACRHAVKGINLILNPSASHFSFAKSEFRYKLIGDSSLKFNCTYLYANLLGNEAGRIIYDGEVLIYQQGKMIQRNNRLSFENVNLISAEIDFTTGHTVYQELSQDHRDKEFEFWEATTLGLFDYMRKSGSKGFVLSLSGGADSSACAVMVYEMVKKGIEELGYQRFLKKAGLSSDSGIEGKNLDEITRITMEKILTTAYQGTRNSGDATLESAKELAESLGAVFYYWTIDKQVENYTTVIEKAIGRNLTWEKDDLTLQNIQARSRAPIIWMLANINNALLITTSNRSEGDVGYATMDGDTAGSIAPIAGVDKDFIRRWLIWAEKNLGHKGLNYVNNLTPTAELRPAERVQTDEKDLMPYSVLAEIERHAIRDRKSPIEVFEILKEVYEKETIRGYIIKFFRMWSRNQWKRERIAPSFHVDEFNVDPRSWCRFPILSGSFREELEKLEKLPL
jgi:NAD+ synthase (glutamine-hydrolysing)